MCLYLLQGYCTVRSNNFNSPKAKDDKRRKREKKKKKQGPGIEFGMEPENVLAVLFSVECVCVCVYICGYLSSNRLFPNKLKLLRLLTLCLPPGVTRKRWSTYAHTRVRKESTSTSAS